MYVNIMFRNMEGVYYIYTKKHMVLSTHVGVVVMQTSGYAYEDYDSLTSSAVVLGLQMSTSSKLGRGRASPFMNRASTVLRTLSTENHIHSHHINTNHSQHFQVAEVGNIPYTMNVLC